MAAAASNLLRSWGAEWARRRQGSDQNQLTLTRKRVYILPTRFGIAFGFLVVAMLLGSLNYGASLGFALTFLLGGLALVVMHHCHNNLLGTQLKFAGAKPVFAGEVANFRFVLRNSARAPRFDLLLKTDAAATVPADLPPGESRTVGLPIKAPERGLLQLNRFGISTRFPGRLFQAWSWVHTPANCLVYPRPAETGRPMPAETAHGSHGRLPVDDADFIGLKQAEATEPPRRLAWKAYARSGELLAKQFSGASAQPRVFDWNDVADLDTEARLSQLARWCIDSAKQQRSFGLRLPGSTQALGSGDRHLHKCLATLALYGHDT